MDDWHTVGAAGDIPDGGAVAADVGGVQVAIVRCGERVFAVSNLCTHAGALLHEGSVDRARCTIECPLHGAEFDLATGEVLTPPAIEPLAVFAVRVQGGDIQISVADRRAGA